MKAYYEELWERMPTELSPPELSSRREYLLAELRPHDRVLDLGCGTGDFTAVAAQAGADAVGVDVAREALRRARASHPGLEFALTPNDGPLPFADCSFDLVWASEVIEHVADTARWLSEVRRVLSSGGRLLVTTPNHGRLLVALGGIERFSQPLGDHLHLYTRSSLREVLHELGFDEVSVRRQGGPPLLRRVLMARAVR